MKTLIIISLVVSTLSFGQDSDSTGMAGDNLDLYAVLDLFEDSKSIEDFELALNKEDNGVNNLDLNNDGTVDYIMVIDYKDSLSHAITLRVPINESESQDVAVIEIEEVGEEITNLQIIGDSDLYGDDYIIEPQTDGSNDVANVYQWKPIRHMYRPTYVVWVSPWRWGHYPHWYHPWKPVRWSIYHHKHHRLHSHYRRVTVRRCIHAHNHYSKKRVHSHWFHNNNMNKKGGNQNIGGKKTGGKVTISDNQKGKEQESGGAAGGTVIQKKSKQQRSGTTINQSQNTKDVRRQRKRPGGTINTNSKTNKTSSDKRKEH